MYHSSLGFLLVCNGWGAARLCSFNDLVSQIWPRCSLYVRHVYILYMEDFLQSSHSVFLSFIILSTRWCLLKLWYVHLFLTCTHLFFIHFGVSLFVFGLDSFCISQNNTNSNSRISIVFFWPPIDYLLLCSLNVQLNDLNSCCSPITIRINH